VMDPYSQSIGFDGTMRASSKIACTNPLTGTFNGVAKAASNRGTLVPDGDLSKGDLVPNSVPARCDERGCC